MGPVFVRRRPLMRLAADAAAPHGVPFVDPDGVPSALVERATAYRAQTEPLPRPLPDPPSWSAAPGAAGPTAGGVVLAGRVVTTGGPTCRPRRPTS
jgi:hypothetical protein